MYCDQIYFNGRITTLDSQTPEGKVVYGDADFKQLNPPLPPGSPDWAPTAKFGGFATDKGPAVKHEHPLYMGADGRLWEAGCGCWF